MANHNDFWSWIMTDQAKTALAGAAGGIMRWVTLRQRWPDAGCLDCGPTRTPKFLLLQLSVPRREAGRMTFSFTSIKGR